MINLPKSLALLFFLFFTPEIQALDLFYYLSTDSLAVSSDYVVIDSYDNKHISIEIGQDYRALATDISSQYENLENYKAYLDTNISAVFFLKNMDQDKIYVEQGNSQIVLFPFLVANDIVSTKQTNAYVGNYANLADAVVRNYMALEQTIVTGSASFPTMTNPSSSPVFSSNIFNRINIPVGKNCAHYKNTKEEKKFAPTLKNKKMIEMINFNNINSNFNTNNNASCPEWDPMFVPQNEYALSPECKAHRRAQRDASNNCPRWDAYIIIPTSNLNAACNAERDRQREENARQNAPTYGY